MLPIHTLGKFEDKWSSCTASQSRQRLQEVMSMSAEVNMAVPHQLRSERRMPYFIPTGLQGGPIDIITE